MEIDYEDVWVTLTGDLKQITDSTSVGELKTLLNKISELRGDDYYDEDEGLSFYGNFRLDIRLADMLEFYKIVNHWDCVFTGIEIDGMCLWGSENKDLNEKAQEGFSLYRRGKIDEFNILWREIVFKIYRRNMEED